MFFQTCNILIDIIPRVYTEKILKPLNKTQLIKLSLKTQKQTSNIKNTLTEEIKEIYRSFGKFGPDIIAVTKVNDSLVQKLSSVEQQCWNI